MRKPASVYPETQLVADPPFEALYTPSYELGAPGYKYSQNLFGALGRGFTFGWGIAKDQWAAVTDYDYTPITAEELKEIPNNELVDFKPWMTREQVDRQIELGQRQQYIDAHRASWYHHVAGFVGALPPILLAPEVLPTLPIGGAAFTAATRAPTLVGMFSQSMKSAAQISAVSIPANIAAQQMTYGRVDNTELALVAVAPFALSPLAAAGFRSYLRRGSGGAADNNTAAGIPRNLEAQFDNYQGGLKAWANDFIQNNATAIDFAKTLNLSDEQLNALRSSFLEQANRTAPTADDAVLQQDLYDLVIGAAGADQVERLRLANVLPDTPEMAGVLARYSELENVSTLESIKILRELADAVPPELQGALRYAESLRFVEVGPVVDDLTIRELQDVLIAVDAGDISKIRPELQPFAAQMIEVSRMTPFDRKLMRPADNDVLDALRRVASSADQESARKVLARALGDMGTEDNRALFKALEESGLNGARLTYLKQLERDVELAVKAIGELEGSGRAAGLDTTTIPEQQALVDSTLARMEQLKAEQARLAEARTNVPPEFNIEDLARELLTAQMRARPVPMSDVGPMPLTTTSRLTEATDLDGSLRAWAERNGANFDDPSSAALRIERIIEECGQ